MEITQSVALPYLFSPDCLYHALAILNDGVFTTKDKNYISKVKKIDYILPLSKYNG